MGRDGAERAASETAAVDVHRVFDHLPRRDVALARVARMRSPFVGEVERVVQFLGRERRVGGGDDDAAAADGFHERRLGIPQAEEEKYRRAARDINSLIAAYKTRFMAEPEDYLAMAALQVAVDKVDLEMKGEMTDQMVRLQEIERRIDGYLNDIKE